MNRLTREFQSFHFLRLSNYLVTLFLLAILSNGCSSRLQLSSHWRDREIATDGKNEEWHGSMTHLEKDSVSIGFFNDEEFLYASMVTSNLHIQRQIMAFGLTLWFDSDGGKDKKFGICFP